VPKILSAALCVGISYVVGVSAVVGALLLLVAVFSFFGALFSFLFTCFPSFYLIFIFCFASYFTFYLPYDINNWENTFFASKRNDFRFHFNRFASQPKTSKACTKFDH
jgi:hypothetical protein